MLWRLEVFPPNPVHWQQRRHEKEKNWETFTCSAVTKLFWHQGPAEILFCNIYRYGQLQHFSLFQTAVIFFLNDNKSIFVQTLIQLLIGIPTNAAQPPAVAARVTWWSLWLNTKTHLWNTGVFFLFCFFFNEKTETNMERLKRPWGCIWGISGLVRRGVKQMNLCIFTSSGTQTHEMMGVRGLEPCKRLHDCTIASLPVCPRARSYIIIAEWMEREAICFLLRWELHRLY